MKIYLHLRARNIQLCVGFVVVSSSGFIARATSLTYEQISKCVSRVVKVILGVLLNVPRWYVYYICIRMGRRLLQGHDICFSLSQDYHYIK